MDPSYYSDIAEAMEPMEVDTDLEERFGRLKIHIENVSDPQQNLKEEVFLNSGLEFTCQSPDCSQLTSRHLGKKKVILACEKETRGTSLDVETKAWRFFSGTFDLNYKEMLLPLRIVLLRSRHHEHPFALSICFPSFIRRPGFGPFYEAMEIRISFFNKDKSVNFTKNFYIDPGNGSCELSNASDEEHLKCEVATCFDPDLCSFLEGHMEAQMKMEEAIHSIVFPHKNQQVFYFKTEIEVIVHEF